MASGPGGTPELIRRALAVFLPVSGPCDPGVRPDLRRLAVYSHRHV